MPQNVEILPVSGVPILLSATIEVIEAEICNFLKEAGLKDAPRRPVMITGSMHWRQHSEDAPRRPAKVQSKMYKAGLVVDVGGDTPEWLAIRIRDGIADWKRFVALEECGEAQWLSLNIGGAYNLFLYKRNLEVATVKGLQQLEHEKVLQQEGVKELKRKRLEKLTELARFLFEECGDESTLAAASDSWLAEKAINKGCPGIKDTLRKDIADARKAGLVPKKVG